MFHIRPDIILVDGERRELCFPFPFEAIIKANAGNVEIVSAIVGDHKGYNAVWEIIRGKLCLVDLIGDAAPMPTESDPHPVLAKSAMEAFFPGQRPPIVANWFSDWIGVPMGRRLRDEFPNEFAYEYVRCMKIENGVVVDSFDARDEKEGQDRIAVLRMSER